MAYQLVYLFKVGEKHYIARRHDTRRSNCDGNIRFRNPAIKSSVHETDDHLLQIAFADDLTGTGSLRSLRTWWETIVKFGHSIGYYANGEKSWLIVRPELIDEAKNIFTSTSIKVTSEGRRHSGVCVGSASFKENYVRSKMQE